MHQIGFSPGPTAALADRADGKEAPPPGQGKGSNAEKEGTLVQQLPDLGLTIDGEPLLF